MLPPNLPPSFFPPSCGQRFSRCPFSSLLPFLLSFSFLLASSGFPAALFPSLPPSSLLPASSGFPAALFPSLLPFPLFLLFHREITRAVRTKYFILSE